MPMRAGQAAVIANRRRRASDPSSDRESRFSSAFDRRPPPPLSVAEAPPPSSNRAAAVIKKALKEATILGRRATFGWRHLRAGVLSFQATTETGGVCRTFAIGKKLGEGGYSTIWLVHEWQPDGSERQLAVKRCILDRNDREQVELIDREIAIMNSIPPHPNIVELIGTCKRQRGTSGSADEVFLLLELCRGGSLAEMILGRADANALLSASEAATAFHDMALALCHLHSQSPPLAHRDVKPENFILSDADGRWRLCDFGSASSATFTYQPGIASYEVANEEDVIHRTSTPQYRAPEMCDVRRGETIGVGVDVWALGVSLYKLLFLRDLFGVPGEERLGSLNFDPTKRLTPAALGSLSRAGTASGSELLLDVLRMCLTPSAKSRPPVVSVLQYISSRSAQVDGGIGMSREGLLEARHAAGMLTITNLRAYDLFPKGSSASRRGVKPYLLLTCGGARRITAVAPRSHDAAWPSAAFALPTHGLQVAELSLWAVRARRCSESDMLPPMLLRLPLPLPSCQAAQSCPFPTARLSPPLGSTTGGRRTTFSVSSA